MAKLADFATWNACYRIGEESKFPWHCSDKSVWYALLLIENGEIERYAFKSSLGDKQALLCALRTVESEDSPLLLGVWTGHYRTDLFVLGIDSTIRQLNAIFLTLQRAIKAVRHLGPRGGFKAVSYEVADPQGVVRHVSVGNREDGKFLLGFFKEKGIKVRDE